MGFPFKDAVRAAAVSHLPVLAAKAWKETEPVRERFMDAAKSIPGHVKDVMAEKREASE